MKCSQSNRILAHLRKAPITPYEALSRYGCFRLGARVYELRAAGHNIVSRLVKRGQSRVAEYRLVLACK